MKIAAIISEYNPFHLGHKYQIDKLKEDLGVSHLISIMSGNYVQRGYPAIIDKYQRAHMASLSGVDLILELPLIYAVSSAEFFAKGSVQILDALNGIDILAFGSEHGSLDDLNKIAVFLNSEPLNYKKDLKQNLEIGMSFPKARSLALKKHLPEIDEKTFLSPNNILAIEYLKSLNLLKSDIQPYTIKRKGTGYLDEKIKKGFYPSATAIRKLLYENKSLKGMLPLESYNHIKSLKKDNYKFTHIKDLKNYFYYRLLTDGENINKIPEAKDGLGNRILNLKSHLKYKSLEEFVLIVKTKRYTHTRITRLIIQFILGFDNIDIINLRKNIPSQVKILKTTEKGNEIISSLRKDSEINLIHNYKKNLDPYQDLDHRSSLIYGLINKSYDPISDFKGFKI